jgi:hypothetical protein
MEDAEKPPLGRPSIYSQELADKICEQIVQGYSMRTICKADDMPCVATIFSWFRTNQPFLEQYEKAKEMQADMLAEDLLDIADDGTNDWMEKYGKDGENLGYQVNGEHIQRSRLRVDTRKWIASKLKAKKYGDRVIQQGDKDADPIQHSHSITSILQSIDGKSSGLPVPSGSDNLDED